MCTFIVWLTATEWSTVFLSKNTRIYTIRSSAHITDLFEIFALKRKIFKQIFVLIQENKVCRQQMKIHFKKNLE